MRYGFLAAVLMLVPATIACADGFIGLDDFSGNETLIDFTSVDMGSLHPDDADIGSGVHVWNYGGGTGTTGWRDNMDWSSYFDNIPGASLGKALSDRWGSSTLIFDFTSARYPNRAGMLISTWPATSYSIRVFDTEGQPIEFMGFATSGTGNAIFVGYEAAGGIGAIQVEDTENGFSTIIDDVRFEHDREVLPVADYLIVNATRSGLVQWQHEYDGPITNTGNFTSHGQPYTRANYLGGSGSLNDGVAGYNEFETQLFVNNADTRPEITIFLEGSHRVGGITLWGCDYETWITGSLAGCDVTIGGQTESFLSSENTPFDEFIDLSNSPLRNLVTDRIVLSNFVDDGNNSRPEWFGIGEITVHEYIPHVFGLSIVGSCPGTVTVIWSNAPPQSTLALVFANNTGSFRIPNGPCQGTILGLGSQGIRLINTFSSGSGNGSRNGSTGPAACGNFLQMVSLQSCEVSDVVQIP